MTSRAHRIVRPAFPASLALLAACEFGGGAGPSPSAFVYLDAPTATVDSRQRPDAPAKMDASVIRDGATADARIDAAIDAPITTAQNHLILTELCLAPTGSEFIEIYNPTGASVDLSHYYLSNHGDYWKYPVGAQSEPLGHFIVQFMTGTTIAAGQVITIATGTSAAFNSAYGANPSYSIADGTMLSTVVTGTPSLTDSGAFVALFYWDGSSTIVKDVDLMIAGQASQANLLLCTACGNKSGVTQGGMTYAADADSIAPQAGTPGAGQSTKRILLEAGHETQAGNGNGNTGHDETSEDTSKTWDSTFTAPTPGVVPMSL